MAGDPEQTQRSATNRPMSASEIAKNVKNTETWQKYNNLEQIAFSDIPDKYIPDVYRVLSVNSKLPYELIDKTSKYRECLSVLSPEILDFLLKAAKELPSLFSKRVKLEDTEECVSDLCTVFSAWRQLLLMKESNERWSEADYAALVYDVLRTPAVRNSSYRTQSSIHLPQHTARCVRPSRLTTRVLKAKTVMPDGSIFIRSNSIFSLSNKKSSPYKKIDRHDSTRKTCGHEGGDMFRFQASPSTQFPSTPGFEFVGAFLEDKKPGYDMLEFAYRQNRMSCAAALRHLHSFCIQAPVFGLIWADGKVRAHVDWYSHPETNNPTLYSATYPGPSLLEAPKSKKRKARPSNSSELSENSDPALFFEWDLSKRSDIISVFLLLRNLDSWVSKDFCERVKRDVKAFAHKVTEDGAVYKPWRCKGDELQERKPLSASSVPATSLADSAPNSAHSDHPLKLPPITRSRPIKKTKARKENLYR